MTSRTSWQSRNVNLKTANSIAVRFMPTTHDNLFCYYYCYYYCYANIILIFIDIVMLVFCFSISKKIIDIIIVLICFLKILLEK